MAEDDAGVKALLNAALGDCEKPLRFYTACILKRSPNDHEVDVVLVLLADRKCKHCETHVLDGRCFRFVPKIWQEQKRLLRPRRPQAPLSPDYDPVDTRQESGLVALMRHEAKSLLIDCLRGLAPFHREVIVGLYWEGKTVAQIAVETETADGTLRSRLKAARDRIRWCLKQKGYDGSQLF